MNVYDVVNADSLEVGDCALIHLDEIEVTSIYDDGDIIMVKGYSHLSGDNVTYLLAPDTEVELWKA